MWLRLDAGEQRCRFTHTDIEAVTTNAEKHRLVCASCRHPITSDHHWFMKDGNRTHDVTNPNDVRFRIGCFRQAPGVRVVGASSFQWTWFPGYAWTNAICAGCAVHIGWRFAGGNDVFYGLIIRLLAPED